MSYQDLVRALGRTPFQPFRIYLSDGTHHEITHPEMLFVGVRTSRLFVTTTSGSEPDQEIQLDNLHITKTVPVAAATPAA